MARLRDCTLALLISGGLAAPLQADLKIRVQETFGRGGTTSLVYYCKEHFWRTESSGGREYMIVDWVNKRSIAIPSTGIGRRQILRKSSLMGGISTFRVNFQL